MTWNGTTITGPVLIFHDEILIRTDGLVDDVNEPGSLICRSENESDISWTFTFRSFRTLIQATVLGGGPDSIPRILQLRRNREDLELTNPDFNGLWKCRRRGEDVGAIPVGVYQRGDGEITPVTPTPLHRVDAE